MAEARKSILARFRAQVAGGQPIIGGGAGTGISAKCEEEGGIDLIVIYNSGRYRMAGRGSLAGLMPYGDANAIVVEMAGEVLPVIRKTPVLAGVNGTDPFRDMDLFLDQLKALGFAGVQNFPTVGLIDGVFRANLEETGMSYALEVEMIAKARAKDMLTTPYVFNAADAKAMAAAGANYVDLNMTTQGHDTWDSTWSMPAFWPWLKAQYSSNPWTLFGRTQFCPGDSINLTVGLTAGFQAYQWRKNGVVISAATSNTIN